METLEAIVKRIFFENRSTLLTESAKLQAADLANTSLELRAQMHNCLPQLPALVFEPEPDRQPGEAGWTAGEESFVRALPKSDYKLLEKGVHNAIGVMDELGTDHEHFGLIHGDLCRQNLILHKGQILPIDFGHAAFGYYFGDMIQLFSTTRIKSDAFRPRLRAFIEGYNKVRQLPDDYVQIILTMFMVWGISSMANDLLYAKELRVEEVKLPRALWVAARYVKGENFLDI